MIFRVFVLLISLIFPTRLAIAGGVSEAEVFQGLIIALTLATTPAAYEIGGVDRVVVNTALGGALYAFAGWILKDSPQEQDR